VGRLLLLVCAACGFSPQARPNHDLGPPDGGGGSFSVTLSVGQVEEHAWFSAHVVALDASGAIDSGYQGQPAFSSSWGDLTSQKPRFIGGTADVMLSLNRETSGNNLAIIKVDDGQAIGSSSGLKVVAPAWQPLDAAAVFQPPTNTWDALISSPRWVRKGGLNYLFYQGTTTGASGYNWGLATSNDGVTWMRNPTPVFAAATSGWDSGLEPTYFYVGLDGDTFVAVYEPYAHPFGVARSSDGVNWTRSDMGQLAATDSACAAQYFMSSFFIDGSSYQTFWAQEGPACVATSSDSGQSFGAMAPLSGLLSVGGLPQLLQMLREGTVYRAWYQDSPDTTLYATSSDGVTWVPSPSAPIPYNIVSVVWNELELRYEAMIPATNGFERVARP
jgi:hypothetical protein